MLKELVSLFLKRALSILQIRGLMITVQVLQLQIVALANARLQVTRRLDQIALRVVVQNLQLLYNLLLVLYHLVLLVNFCLEPPDLYLLFVCLKLY